MTFLTLTSDTNHAQTDNEYKMRIFQLNFSEINPGQASRLQVKLKHEESLRSPRPPLQPSQGNEFTMPKCHDLKGDRSLYVNSFKNETNLFVPKQLEYKCALSLNAKLYVYRVCSTHRVVTNTATSVQVECKR